MPNKRVTKKKTWLWLSAIAAVVGFFVLSGGGPSEQCKTSLAEAERLSTSDPRQAGMQLQGARKSCENSPTSMEKIAALTAAIQPSLQALQVCDRIKREIEAQIGDGRVRQAQRLFAAQAPSCAARPDMQLLRQAAEDARRNAVDKLIQARLEIADGRISAAQALTSEAEKLDRETPELARTLRAIDGKQKELADAAAAASRSSEPSFPYVRPGTQQQAESRPSSQFEPKSAPQVPVVVQAPVVDARRVECDVLVRGGQRALTNRAYDVAMQQAEDAISAFPGCPGAIDLSRAARQAKDRARSSVVIQ